LKALSLLQAFE